jgi:outer membrane protein assembly factor BamB
MKRREFLAATTGVLVTIAGCTGDSGRTLPVDPTGAWRHHAHDPRNTSNADVSVPARGNLVWNAGDAHVAAPLVDDGTVYSVAETATALDAETGKQLWDSELPGTTKQTPALDDDNLIVATDQRLLALSRDDGTEQWSVPLPRPARRPVTLSTEPPLVTVPLAARRGKPGLLAYDTSTGDKVWEESTLAARMTAIEEKTVYTTGYKQDGNTGVVRGLSITDGTQLWEAELESPDTAPVVSDTGVLVADGGTLAIHDIDSGMRDRSLGTFGDRIGTVPAVADDTVYVTTQNRAIVAVSLNDESIRWRKDAGVVNDTGISVGRDAVVASVTNLHEYDLAGIAAFEREDGALRWEHPIEGFDAYPSTPPILAEESVFYTSNESSGVVALGDLPPSDKE